MVIGDESAPEHRAVRRADQDCVAAGEITLDPGDADRQQARALVECGHGPGIDMQRAARLQAAADPGLAGARRRPRG